MTDSLCRKRKLVDSFIPCVHCDPSLELSQPSAIFPKGDSFCEFKFAFLGDKTITERVLFIKKIQSNLH